MGERRKSWSVISIKVVVKGKGGDENTEKGTVHDTKHGTQNGAISDHARRRYTRTRVLSHLTWKERDDK